MSVVTFIPEAGEYRAQVQEQGLLLQPRAAGRNERFLDWPSIRSLWPRWSGSILVIMDMQGDVTTAETPRVRGQNPDQIVREMWDAWGRALAGQAQTNVFEYSSCFRERDRSQKKSAILQCLGLAVLLGGAGLLLFFSEMKSDTRSLVWPAVGMLMAVFFLFAAAAVWLDLRRPQVARLSIEGGGLTVEYEDRRRAMASRGVQKARLSAGGTSRRVVLGDGTKLEHLERFDYWPLLQCRLIDVFGLCEERETA